MGSFNARQLMSLGARHDYRIIAVTCAVLLYGFRNTIRQEDCSPDIAIVERMRDGVDAFD